ncbi:MAG: helix-turn-helix domain-containing protein [bacterium]|nr:helix-turn-helix domain-containing protein [bacterium]
MRHAEEQTLLVNAAKTSLERVEEDRAAASSVVMKELLAHLEVRLLDPELLAEQWLKECGVHSGSFLVNFHSQLGQPPGFYLWDLRMEITARLLATTALTKKDIACLIGFSGNQAFNKSFERWSGLHPMVFRNNMRKAVEKVGSPSEDFFSTRFLRKVIRGGLDPAQALELYTTLQKLSALSRQRPGLGKEPATIMGHREIEQLVAADLWEEIKDREPSEQRLLVRSQVCFTTTELFDFLRHKSVEESRRNRRRGVDAAELALESLELCAGELGADLPNRRAQGWVWIASAHCLASDFPKTEEGFARARFELECAGAHRDPLVAAEMERKTAKLRWYQRRYDEALKLLDSALVVFRRTEGQVEVARSLIIKACIQRDVGAFQVAIGDFKAGLDLINEKDEPLLCFSGRTGLALAYALAGDSENADRWLAKCDLLCRTLGNDLATYQLRWTVGLVEYTKGNRRDAAEMLAEARDGLAQLEEIGYTAVVSLDLAMLYSEEGRAEDAIQVAAEALPMLQALNFRGEVLAAVQVLREAIDREELPLSVLQQVRSLVAGGRAVIGV